MEKAVYVRAKSTGAEHSSLEMQRLIAKTYAAEKGQVIEPKDFETIKKEADIVIGIDEDKK